MSSNIKKDEIARRLASRVNTDEATASKWVDQFIEVIYESLKAGESVNLLNLGTFYVREERTWVFKFSPAQRLKALFGWSSTYKGPL